MILGCAQIFITTISLELSSIDFFVQAVAERTHSRYTEVEDRRGDISTYAAHTAVYLAAESPPSPGDLRIYNQLTETFTVNELANRVKEAAGNLGLDVEIKSIANPRKEKEEHYYNPTATGLLELGLQPNYMSDSVLVAMLKRILLNRENSDGANYAARSVELMRQFKDKTVLVTGAGTVGAELVRQLVGSEAASVICIDNNETELFFLLEQYRANEKVSGHLADVRDREALKLRMRGVDIGIQQH